jgi:hypothetical protein
MKISLLESVRQEAQSHRAVAASQRRALDETRRVTCNRIARTMRRLGFRDAVAEQKDTGRRDVTVLVGPDPHYDSLIIGVFYDGHIGLLAPFRRRSNQDWLPIAPNLENLPLVLRHVLLHHV